MYNFTLGFCIAMLIAMIVGLKPMDANGEDKAKDKDKPKKVVM